MSVKKLKYFLLPFFIVLISVIEIGFTPRQKEIVVVHGRGLFDFGKYGKQSIRVWITEDGKSFKTLNTDDRGNFTAKIGLNHLYMFHLSMDYHGTSKVQIDTRVPDIVAQDMKGAEFQFEVDMYELYQGMNMGLLNRPLLKMKYNPKKDRFEFDKNYANDMRYDMESFLARMEEMRAQKRKVLKEDPKKKQKPQEEKKQEIAKKEETQDRKVIEFEVEKKKVAENKRGSKNIMEYLEEPKKAELKDEPEVEEILAQVEEIEEEVIEEEAIAFNVVPKRTLINEENSGSEAQDEQLALQKMKMREAQEIKRLEEQARIREQVRSLNQQIYALREKRMKNKDIQNDRLRHLIKTIALAEIYLKMEEYKNNPIDHNEVVPSTVVASKESFWMDEERIMVRYPDRKTTYRKETFLFGITYFYRGDEEINEDTFCQEVSEASKNSYICVN